MKKVTGKKMFLSRSDIAGVLGCSPESVANLEKAGKIRAIRLSERLIRYKAADVEKLLS